MPGLFCRSQLATCRVELDAARLTVLAAADALDKQGNKKVGTSRNIEQVHPCCTLCCKQLSQPIDLLTGNMEPVDKFEEFRAMKAECGQYFSMQSHFGSKLNSSL